MSDESLLEQFLSEDCEPFVADILLQEIEECSGVSVTKDHTFNRFNIRLLFDENKAVIEDDLNPGENGELVVSLSEFKTAVESTL